MEVVGQTTNGQHFVVSEIEFIGQRHTVATNQCGSLGSFGKEQFVIAAEHEYVHRFHLWVECVRIFHIIVECKFQPKLTPRQVFAYSVTRGHTQHRGDDKEQLSFSEHIFFLFRGQCCFWGACHRLVFTFSGGQFRTGCFFM